MGNTINADICKTLHELYDKNKQFKSIIEYAVDNILTDLVVKDNFDPEIMKSLYEITYDKMFKEIYNIMVLITEQKSCPICGGKFKFSGCPILVCKKCKREFTINDPEILKLCDYCISNKINTCNIRKTIHNMEDNTWKTKEDLQLSTEKPKLVNFSKE